MRERSFDGLLVDYVLGELEPEVEALVESYIEVEPSAKARCEETRDLLGMVGRIDEGEFVRVVPGKSRRVVFTIAAAALLTMGFLALMPREDEGGVEVAVVEKVTGERGGGGGFWSIPERQSRRDTGGKKRRLVWESMTRVPKIEDERL